LVEFATSSSSNDSFIESFFTCGINIGPHKIVTSVETNAMSIGTKSALKERSLINRLQSKV
jgi:hypothetical protein